MAAARCFSAVLGIAWLVEGGRAPSVHLQLERRTCAATSDDSSLCDVLRAPSAERPLAPPSWPSGVPREAPLAMPPQLALTGSAVPVVKVPLENHFNILYTTVADIGVPPVKVRLIVDTGSSDLWLKSSSVAAPFGGGHVYNPSQSTLALASRGDIQITYGQGRVEGREFRDRVCLEALCIQNQSLVFADTVTGIPDQWLFDGILGLGYAPLARDHYGPTFVESLGKMYDTLGIGFSLGAGDGVGGGLGSGGHLTIGELEDLRREAVAAGLGEGITMRLYGINNQAMYWLVPATIAVAWPHPGEAGALRGVAAAPQPMTMITQPTSAMAILDTGTSLISVPQLAYMNLIGAMMKGRPDAVQKCTNTLLGSFGQMLCLCDTQLNPVTFTLSGIDGRQLQVTLQAQDLMQLVGVGAIGSGVCRVNVMPSPLPLWILGDVFLRHVYAIDDVAKHHIHIYPQRGSSAVVILNASASQMNSSGSLDFVAVALPVAAVALPVAAAGFIAALAVRMYTLRGRLPTRGLLDAYSAF